MYRLIDSILGEDYVSATRMFEEAMEEIKEQKFYEVKRSLELVEAEGKGEFKGQYYNDKEDWARYRKSHPSLGYYDTPKGETSPSKKERKMGGGLTKHGMSVRREKRGYVDAKDWYAAKVYIDTIHDLLKKKTKAVDSEISKLTKRSRRKATKELDEVVKPTLKVTKPTLKVGNKNQNQDDEDQPNYNPRKITRGQIPPAVASLTRTGKREVPGASEKLKRAQNILGKLKGGQSDVTGQGGTMPNLVKDKELGNPNYKGSSKSQQIQARQQGQTWKHIRNAVRSAFSGQKNIKVGGTTTNPQVQSVGPNPARTVRNLSRAARLIGRTGVGKAWGVVKAANSGLNSVFSSAGYNESYVGENLGFQKPRKRRIVKRKPLQRVKKLKLKKNKYHTEVPEPRTETQL